MIARVAIDTALDRLFDYSIPAGWEARALPGTRVTVNFGHRTTVGYVVEVASDARDDRAGESGSTGLPLAPPPEPLLALPVSERAAKSLKPLLSIEGDRPFLLPSLLRLARWIADYYCAPIELCLRTLLPAPVRAGHSRDKTRLFVEAAGGGRQSARGSPPPGVGSRVSGVGAESEAPRNAQRSTLDAQRSTETLSPRQRELLDNIRRVGGGWLQALCTEFGCAPETLRKLAAAGHLAIAPRAIRRDPLANRRILPTKPLPLMPEQSAALAAVVEACDAAEGGALARDSAGRDGSPDAAVSTKPPCLPGPQPGSGRDGSPSRPPAAVSQNRPVLLYGVTGSGKTEVYLQAIAHVLARGRGAIVLVPEIALTPQTVQRFAGRFGDRIAVLHSALSDGERHDEWQRIRKGEARVVIGPRSALFAPVERLGLIVVDEEHEPSYKQDETPRYHARDAAVMRAHLEPCAVLLGSATPSLESWRNVARGKYLLARLPRRADNAAMPLVHVVDMRREMARSGHVQVFSQFLLDAVRGRLERGEQTMLFLNRRGYATSLVCPACGFVATCEACNVAFTYHRVDDCLRCHICGAWQRPEAACPACRDPRFRFAGFGTQRIEQIVAKCFPRARVARMDADATARRLSHDDILGAFRAGRTDILIGTQMIAKGLHFPNVTLVGIVLADSSLHLPDFRAGERTFQLLAQVAGRTGRGATPGEVVVQTYTPEHPAVTAARTEDFEAFALGEMPLRAEMGYPPFAHLACLTLRGADERRTAFTAETIARALQAGAPAWKGLLVSDACPAPLAKARGEYRYQVMLRAPAAAALRGALLPVLRANRPPPEVALALDMDAVNVM